MVKNLPANAGDIGPVGSIPGLGRSHGGGCGNPLQCSCLENPMDRGAWWATVHGVAKNQTWLEQRSMHAQTSPSDGGGGRHFWGICFCFFQVKLCRTHRAADGPSQAPRSGNPYSRSSSCGQPHMVRTHSTLHRCNLRHKTVMGPVKTFEDASQYMISYLWFFYLKIILVWLCGFIMNMIKYAHNLHFERWVLKKGTGRPSLKVWHSSRDRREVSSHSFFLLQSLIPQGSSYILYWRPREPLKSLSKVSRNL